MHDPVQAGNREKRVEYPPVDLRYLFYAVARECECLRVRIEIGEDRRVVVKRHRLTADARLKRCEELAAVAAGFRIFASDVVGLHRPAVEPYAKQILAVSAAEFDDVGGIRIDRPEKLVLQLQLEQQRVIKII